MEIGEQVNKLATYTFSNFIRCKEVQEAIKEHSINYEMPHMRFVYIYYLFKKIHDFIGDKEILDVFNREFAKKNIRNPTLQDVSKVCTAMDVNDKTEICLILEKLTRGQNQNVLWEVLRDGVISSSKLLKIIKQQTPDSKIFHPVPIEKNHYVASPIAFGVRNEVTVKTLLAEFVSPSGTSNINDFGFMLSPLDGIFGVSLDMCCKCSIEKDGRVAFNADTEIYEIKCRYKYLFAKNEYDPIYKAYSELYNNPGKAALVNFISAIQKPAVEHVPRGKLPTQNDYLLSFDKVWNFNPQIKKRRMTSQHKLTEQCMRYNCYTESKVIILTDPALTSGKIDIKDTFFVDVYVNPRHSYYYQCLLQYKIVTNYIQFSSSSAKGLGKPQTFLVTAFFRKRNSSDFAKTYIKSESNFVNQALEIPVLLIITPVFVPHEPLIETLEQAITFWQSSVKEEFNQWPWAPVSLGASGDVTP